MTHDASSLLTPWTNFYVITGSSSAALIGLMFVVITLVMGADSTRRSPEGTSAFSTPTVVHFGTALFISVAMNAPWRVLVGPSVILGVAGVFGVAYVVLVAIRIGRLDGYKADLEDQMCHTVLPLAAYAATLGGAVLLPAYPVPALYTIAAADAAFIFVGIHNAWDVVTFIAVRRPTE